MDERGYGSMYFGDYIDRICWWGEEKGGIRIFVLNIMCWKKLEFYLSFFGV